MTGMEFKARKINKGRKGKKSTRTKSFPSHAHAPDHHEGNNTMLSTPFVEGNVSKKTRHQPLFINYFYIFF
jgi:hypothetical protein